MIRFKTKKEMMVLNDSEIIEEVRQHKFLYDLRSPDYRNLPLRNEIWQQISNKLLIDPPSLVQKRWKVIREKFCVAYRKFHLEKIVPSWSLYDSCLFLSPFVNMKIDRKKEKLDLSTYAPEEYKAEPLASPFDEQQLIALIRSRPVLYDKKREDFRSSSARTIAWSQIAKTAGWDVLTLQKRWRVMRDRFVRELRRTRTAEGDTQIAASSFFRGMMFLINHVKSKSYEASALNNDELSRDSWNASEFDANTNSRQTIESLETCIVQADNNSCQENVVIVDEDQYDTECFEESTTEELFDEGEEKLEQIEDYYDSKEEIPKNETADITVEETTDEQWLKQDSPQDEPVIKKRRISYDSPLAPDAKYSEPSSASSHRASDSFETNDEDVAFGNTIACMLKKYPPRLKTSVKLKIFQALAEFEQQNMQWSQFI